MIYLYSKETFNNNKNLIYHNLFLYLQYGIPGFIQSLLSVASLESLKLLFVFASELVSFDPITPALLLKLLLSLLAVVCSSRPGCMLEMLPVGLLLPTLPGAVKEPEMLVTEGTLLSECPPIFNKLEKESVMDPTPPDDCPKDETPSCDDENVLENSLGTLLGKLCKDPGPV